MRLKQFFQLMMVVLFVFTFQKITIHSKQHLLEVSAECHLCHASEHLDLHHQQESLPLNINEHVAIKENRVEETKIVQTAYDLTQKPLLRRVDVDGLIFVTFDTPSLGYFSTAPPSVYS